MAETFNQTVQDQERQIDSNQEQILSAARNIRRLAEEAEDAGQATAANLADQRDKLNLAEEGMDRVDHKLDEAEAGLHDLDKCCGLCVLPWRRFRSPKAKNKNKKNKNKGNQNEAMSNSDETSSKTTKTPNKIQENEINLTRIVEGDKREDEVNEHMQYTSKAINNLHSMALDIGMELDAQNAQLDRIDTKAQNNNARLESVGKHAARRLK